MTKINAEEIKVLLPLPTKLGKSHPLYDLHLKLQQGKKLTTHEKEQFFKQYPDIDKTTVEEFLNSYH